LDLALTAGQVQAVAHSPGMSPAARATLLHAYRVGFSGALNDLMVIGAIVAFIGAVAAYCLVRQGDFVVSGVAGAAPPDIELRPEPVSLAQGTPVGSY
jgi:hypothetical protein